MNNRAESIHKKYPLDSNSAKRFEQKCVGKKSLNIQNQ